MLQTILMIYLTIGGVISFGSLAFGLYQGMDFDNLNWSRVFAMVVAWPFILPEILRDS